MIFEITNQVRVTNIMDGQKWYETVLKKKPDFIPHEGFAEWELIPGCWLQVAEGIPTVGNGPIRFGVTNIESERERLVKELGIEEFEIHSRPEVPVKWGAFSDPWGNQLGFFEYQDKVAEQDRIKIILGKIEV
ncbi:VOC family protein [Robertmurraya yapensis]|uniref:VOC family protein n=2 Tax=Bacillaceae TaxID=186817 RepID=A0A3S0KQX9_9BACI|nr:VOC family protein [Bacillus yapensis]RTR35837.1 VOC family protein [Bacillus yapensis]TKS98639.1 VOC family protein [Bacillus yapensis]